MAVDFQITQKDNRPFIRARLWNPDGSNPLLTGATVRFTVISSGGTTVVNTTAVTIIDPVLAIVEYHWTVGDTTTVGSYVAQFKVTLPDTTTESYPDDARYITLQINASLA